MSYTVKKSMRSFKNSVSTPYEHLSYSPDLNLIKDIWVHMKKMLHVMYLYISNMKKAPEKIKF